MLRILERLSTISGEKPRTYEENEDQQEKVEEGSEKKEIEQSQERKQEPVKHNEKKKKKGVGYASRPGEAFDVAAYLNNAKQRNE